MKPTRSMAMLADPRQNCAQIVRDISRRLHFDNCYIDSDPAHIRALVEGYKADIIVIEEQKGRPAAHILRDFLRFPICTLTPIIVIAEEARSHQHALLQNVCHPFFLIKPLSPGRFDNVYNTIEKVWSQGFYPDIKEAIRYFKSNENNLAIAKLITLTKNIHAQKLVVPAIATILRRSGQTAAAEKLLLSALQNAPSNAGIMLSLSDLYIHCAMPYNALRILHTLDKIHPNHPVGYQDKLQSHLMLQDISAAIEVIKNLPEKIAQGYPYEILLSRLMYADGAIKELREFPNGEQLVNSNWHHWEPLLAPASKAAS